MSALPISPRHATPTSPGRTIVKGGGAIPNSRPISAAAANFEIAHQNTVAALGHAAVDAMRLDLFSRDTVRLCEADVCLVVPALALWNELRRGLEKVGPGKAPMALELFADPTSRGALQPVYDRAGRITQGQASALDALTTRVVDKLRQLRSPTPKAAPPAAPRTDGDDIALALVGVVVGKLPGVGLALEAILPEACQA